MSTASPQEISDYLDDMKAGIDAGPVGTPEFRQAVYESQERRKRGTPARDYATTIDPDGGRS